MGFGAGQALLHNSSFFINLPKSGNSVIMRFYETPLDIKQMVSSGAHI